ncbi:hypothetical protein M011DRAFT_252802 [Sporormia fimetaria CBS 119925]|uniref:GPI inositol-deacylase n=1 Tax=Sporormia fimetaria CBS 119925 TaxID=1340428 RepID=A0A6A6V160_9PLEO|nr:hypothetical protein M011DRAFT_252802 [Sporormia fimetaria CBS 119925]
MDSAFRRRRKTKTSLDVASLASVLAGLSIDDPTIHDDDDAFGALGLINLLSPAQPLVDIIFVHGLAGGSRKTWSSSKKLQHFWPKEWLSRDPGFEHARVYSFGYRSDWINTKSSILDVGVFAETLLASIQSSPSMVENRDSRIIFVAHSMGGLVVKKACIDANTSSNYQDIASRIESIFFLGTPHNGSEIAKTAETIVALSPFHGNKPYVKDLIPASTMIRTINHDFPRYSKNLQLFSFIETLETRVGGTSRLIVSRDSAVMGYANEKRIHMNKDHRGICKFETPTDPDFIILRNNLCWTINNVIQRWNASLYEHDAETLRNLQDYLDVREKPEDVLIELEDVALPGSASWFFNSSLFCMWRDCGTRELGQLDSFSSPGTLESPQMLWVNALPGAGKSILASQVVNHLEDHNMNCYYYFFSLEDRMKSSVSGLLRSIAFQMAANYPNIRQKLLRLKESGVSLDSDKNKLIWRKLFVNCIFTYRIDRPQYWIIDALDECRDFDNLLAMFGKVETSFPLRIFLTSRPLPQIKNKMESLSIGVCEYYLNVDDIEQNIKRFIQDGPHSQVLHHTSDLRRQKLTGKILAKSEGCFLWVVLVMQELEHAYSTEDVERILDEIPPGMDKLYTRALTEIVGADEERKRVTKAMLSFVVCAMRPLTVGELAHALRIHLRVTLLENAIRSACGNIIHVNKSGRVCLVHQTARDFLLDHGLFETFKMNFTDGNHSIALICLDYLRSTHMRPVKVPASLGPSTDRIERRLGSSPFAQYACMHFSDHIKKGSSDDDILLESLYKFLTANGISWIEHVAACGKLSVLVQTSQNLRGFLYARGKRKPLIDEKSQFIERWSVDLIRIVAKFGKHLTKLPQSIYVLVPPLAPRESAIASQYDRRRGIDIVSMSNDAWDDRLCGISFQEARPTAVASGESTFAIGLQNGTVLVYDNVTFQLLHSFQHGEAVKMMQYSSTGDLLISAGRRRSRLWNVLDNIEVWEETTTVDPLSLAFTDGDRRVIGITRSNILIERDTTSGREVKRIVRPSSHLGPSIHFISGGDINCASLDVAANLLATVHRGHPIILSELDTNEEIGQCEPNMVAGTREVAVLEPVVAVAICPNPDVNLLAVVHRDGALTTYDTGARGALVETVQDFIHVQLACSPDGRTIAVGEVSGMILLYEAVTLRLIYRINHRSDLAIRAIAFSANSERLIDIRESQCNVWEPPVLMRTDLQETESMSDMLPAYNDHNRADETENVSEITAITSTSCGEFVICGTSNGSVVLHRTDTGRKINTLYEHAARSCISQISISSHVIVSIGGTNDLVVKRYRSQIDWTSEGLLHEYTKEPIRQVLFNSEGTKLLVAFDCSAVLRELGPNGTTHKFHRPSAETWANDPASPDRLYAIRHDAVALYTWNDLSLDATLAEAVLQRTDTVPLIVQYVGLASRRHDLGIVYSSSASGPVSTFGALLPCSSFAGKGLPPVNLGPIRTSIRVHHIIGISDGKIFFLNKDLWVCSVALGSEGARCSYHMFIPDEWLKANNRPLLILTAKSELALVKRDEVVIIKRPFTYSTVFST